MNPVSPDSDNEHSQQPDLGIEAAPDDATKQPTAEAPSQKSVPASAQNLHNRRWTDQPAISSLEKLQRRYTDQLSQDIEQLEAEKSRLQADIAELKQTYEQLKTESPSTDNVSTTAEIAKPIAKPVIEQHVPQPNATHEKGSPAENVPVVERGPRLPGEKEVPPPPIVVSPPVRAASAIAKERSIELPTPATSQQRRQQREPKPKRAEPITQITAQRGLMLSAIATLITAWHYGLVSTLHQGGSWLGLSIGQLGIGFVPAVALLWLRMLVVVPAMVLLAPQLHRTTWEDLLDWFYSRERLFIPLIGSGTALFFSQVLMYQSLGSIGPAIGTALLFLYPLSAIPLGLGLRQEKGLTPFGLLAVVAIAMGGLLIAKPTFAVEPMAVGLSILASLALSTYIVLTNQCYRLRCHPIPTAIVQFSTVAVLSSLVLLVKPLKLVSISWLSLCFWGLLIGVLMLLAYLLTYASLLNIRSKTAIIAATTPIAALILSWGFTPRPPLQIIQWTGIMLVAIGGIALGKEKLGKEKTGKEKIDPA